MKLTLIICFLYASLYAQKTETKKAVDKEKLQIETDLYKSNISKKTYDALYKKSLNEQNSLTVPKSDFDAFVKQEVLNERDKMIPEELDGKKIFIDSDQDGFIDRFDVENNSYKMLEVEIFSEIEAKLEAEIESDTEFAKKRLHGPSQFDSRIELLQLDPNVDWQFKILSNSQSVALIIEKENLSQLAKDTYVLDTSKSLGNAYGLCTDEAFYNQPVAGIGTAFVISKNTMLTANHVFERPVTDYIVVFGYKVLIAQTGVTDYYFDKKDIYFPKSIKKQNLELDLIEFKVDRNFEVPVLEWEDTTLLSKANTEVYMIGHPTGLPLKVALNASIEDDSNPFYFYTSLDSFQGNSGSPVFNIETNKVIGVLVSGEIDYKFNGNCYYSPLCKIPYCKGEKVVKLNSFFE